MAFTNSHGERIKRELQAAGINAIGLLKYSIRFLPKMIGENEHIQAVIYGRYPVGNGSKVWKWEEGTMIATDQRVIFLDRKPGYFRADNIAYSEVSAAQALTAWPFSAVTVMSKVGTFSLRYVKMALAGKFIDYVESRRTT